MLFSNLSANQEYLLKIQALTSSLYQENLVYPGVISEVRLQIGDTDNVVVDISCNNKLNDKSYIIMSSVKYNLSQRQSSFLYSFNVYTKSEILGSHPSC